MIIRRFIFWTFIAFLSIGIAMHFQVAMPNLLGRIPGDVVLYNKTMVIHLPIASAALFGVGITTLFSIIIPRKK